MHSVEYIGKCRRLIYLKADGKVQGKVGFGSCPDYFSGDELLIAIFNDINAPDKFGCIEAYFNVVGTPKPTEVNLVGVEAAERTAREFLVHRAECNKAHRLDDCSECKDTFTNLCEQRDTCITHIPIDKSDVE